MKKIYFSGLISFIFSFLIVFILFRTWTFLYWTNALFYIGLVYLLVGCILVVRSGSFFSAFMYSFKHFFHVISKKEQIIQEIEGKKLGISLDSKPLIPSKPWLYIGLSYCMVSLIFSLQIVYFGR